MANILHRDSAPIELHDCWAVYGSILVTPRGNFCPFRGTVDGENALPTEYHQMDLLDVASSDVRKVRIMQIRFANSQLKHLMSFIGNLQYYFSL